MPGYTRPWSQVLNLLGSRDADEIDDASREAHVDLTQRFSDIVKDVNADPWELRAPGFGAVVNYDIPAHGGNMSSGVSWGGTILEVSNLSSATLDGFITFPVLGVRGARITSFSMTGRKQDPAATLFMTLAEVDAVLPGGTVVANLTIADGDVAPDLQTVVHDPVNFLLQPGKAYYFSVEVRGLPFNGAASLSSIQYTLQLPAETP